MPLQAVKLPISHNNVVGENTVLQLNILETGVLTLVVQITSLQNISMENLQFQFLLDLEVPGCVIAPPVGSYGL